MIFKFSGTVVDSFRKIEDDVVAGEGVYEGARKSICVGDREGAREGDRVGDREGGGDGNGDGDGVAEGAGVVVGDCDGDGDGGAGV